jgi:small conductance mechanosensitive channel
MRYTFSLVTALCLVAPVVAQETPAEPPTETPAETPTETPAETPAETPKPKKPDATEAAQREAVEQHEAEAQAKSNAASTAVGEATAALKEAQKRAQAADAALAEATAKAAAAAEQLTSAEATLEQATGTAEETKAAAEAEGATEEQKQAAAAAQTQLEAAQQAVEALKAASAETTAAQEAAEQAAETAAEALKKAQATLDTATKKQAEAQAKKAASQAARAAMERVANTPRGPEMAMDELRLRVKPLTVEELVAEADAWLEVLKTTATGISYAEIASRSAEGREKKAIEDALTKLREDRTDTIDRLDLVLAELERKGGDTADYERYKAAISGLDFNPQDVSATYTAVMGWVLSEKGGIRWALNVIKFILVLVVFRIIGSIVSRIMGRALSSARVKTSGLLKDFFINVTRKTVSFLGIVVALSMLEVNVAPFLAAMGGGALVVGLALQGTLGNFAAGVMILMYRPYDIGDVVSVSGVTGKVDAMSLVATTLKTPDNQMVVVPNGSIWGGIITNITGTQRRRVDLVFGIGYEDDMAKAEAILAEIVESHEKVLKDPEPVIKVHELADSSVNFVCRPWCKTADYWDVYWDLTRQVKEKFDEASISIPYPQTDVHVHTTAAAS